MRTFGRSVLIIGHLEYWFVLLLGVRKDWVFGRFFVGTISRWNELSVGRFEVWTLCRLGFWAIRCLDSKAFGRKEHFNE